MKLFEALAERKAVKERMEELKRRIHQNALAEEGQVPTEDPMSLLEELRQQTSRFEWLVTRINATNAASQLPDGSTLADAVIRKDMQRYLRLVLTNLADKATPPQNRYSHREVRQMPSVKIAEIRALSDENAREARRLDALIQEHNWSIELIV